MSEYTIIADVGQTLVRTLWLEMQIDPQMSGLIDNEDRLSLESPFDLSSNDAVRLSIYLYRIVENSLMKNQFPSPGLGPALRKPPLTLDLFYLVTPLVGAPREQHIVLGKAMQILYDRAILAGADLQGSLTGETDEIRIVLNPVTLEETTRVWQALEMSYRLSVCYVARVALVDSGREHFDQPIVRRTARYSQV